MGENLFLFNLEEKKKGHCPKQEEASTRGPPKRTKIKKKKTKDGWFPARVFSFRYNYLD